MYHAHDCTCYCACGCSWYVHNCTCIMYMYNVHYTCTLYMYIIHVHYTCTCIMYMVVRHKIYTTAFRPACTYEVDLTHSGNCTSKYMIVKFNAQKCGYKPVMYTHLHVSNVAYTCKQCGIYMYMSKKPLLRA